MKRPLAHTLIFLVCACTWLSCTKEKSGTIDVSLTPPQIVGATLQPPAINVDTDTINVVPLGNNIYRISVMISAITIDRDGGTDIGPLSLTVYDPRAGTPLSSLAIPPSSVLGDTARYAGPVSFQLARSDAGNLTVDFQSQDNAGLLSNAIRLSFNVSRTNSSPQLANLVAPDTVVRPTSGRTVFSFSVAATDSDGYTDLAEVTFRQISPTPSAAVQLFDSGNFAAHGDQVPGDGIFSVLIQIDSSNTLGTRRLVFLARDRFDALSDSLFHQLTIRQ